MSLKRFILGFSIFTCFCRVQAQNSKDSSIALLYEGSIMRQVPVVIFHLPHVSRTIYDSAHVFKIEVTENEYCNIEQIVKRIDKYPKDSILSSPYHFIMRRKDSLIIVPTSSLRCIREAFRDIGNVFKGYWKRKHVQEVLNNVYKYMKFEYYY